MRKRILHIISSLGGGGAERQLANLVRNSSADEFEHIVCPFKDAEFFAPVIRQAGHQVHQLDVFGKHPWISGTSKVASAIGKYKPDLIKTWLYDANIIGRLARRHNRRIPLITTLHSPDYDPETIRNGNWSPVKVAGLRQVDKWTARFANPHFVAVSNYVKKSYIEQLNIAESRIRVIYNGIDPDSIESTDDEAQRLRLELGIPLDAFIYITVGRLDAAKNHQILLQVFPQVLRAIPNAFLVIVGTGVLEQQLKDEAEALGIGSRARFLGKRGDIGTCLEMSDAFVFPTLFEGFGIALVEAMFKRLPCISSNLEVLREIVSHNENGLLFNPNKQDELVSAMTEIAVQPELRRKLVENALTEAEKRFHIRITVAEWEKFYRFLLDKSKQN